nr:MAG TPA: hypothetical protein [Caudoviricetes sp.]
MLFPFSALKHGLLKQPGSAFLQFTSGVSLYQKGARHVFRLLLKVSFITTKIFTTNIVTKNALVR